MEQTQYPNLNSRFGCALFALVMTLALVPMYFVATQPDAPAASIQLIPTNTPAHIPAILVDTGETLYCYLTPQNVVGTPYPHPIFWTATALASISPSPSPTATSTTVGLQTKTPTPIWITPVATGTLPTPTQETVPIATVASSPTPITMTVISGGGLNVRQCAAGINPSTACPIVRVAGSGTYVNATGETYEASTITWRKLTSGEWIAEIINEVRVLGI